MVPRLPKLDIPACLTCAGLLLLASGCVLSEDFAGNGLTLDNPADAGVDASADASNDASTSPDVEGYPLTPRSESCLSPVTVHALTARFEEASDHLFQPGSPSSYGLGRANRDAFSEPGYYQTVGAAAATGDNKLAIGWATVDIRNLVQDDDAAVSETEGSLDGGALVTLSGAAPGGRLRVFDVEMLPVSGRDAQQGDRFQLYNLLVMTNAGVFGCEVHGYTDEARADDPHAFACRANDTLNQALSDAQLYPARSLQAMPLVGSFDNVLAIEGGRDSSRLGLMYLRIFPAALEPIELGDATPEADPGTFFAPQLAYGWPPRANDYPFLYMVDHADGPQPLELARASDENVQKYWSHSDGASFPTPPSLPVARGAFSFTYRLDGTRSNGWITSGYVARAPDGESVILGLEDASTIPDGYDWMEYQTPDVDKLWTFANGGASLVVLRHGQRGQRLEMASWNLDATLQTDPSVLTGETHQLENIDDLEVSADWLPGLSILDPTFNYSTPRPVPGLLAMTAEHNQNRQIYLLSIPNVRDVSTLCNRNQLSF